MLTYSVNMEHMKNANVAKTPLMKVIYSIFWMEESAES